jgi:hypothetical protein
MTNLDSEDIPRITEALKTLIGETETEEAKWAEAAKYWVAVDRCTSVEARRLCISATEKKGATAENAT